MTRTVESILIPTDGSEGAMIAELHGVDLAATLGANVHTLSVFDTRDREPSMTADIDELEYVQLLEERAEHVVSGFYRRAQSRHQGEVTTAVRRGVPFKEITAYVDDHDVDLVVMGTHGRTGLDRFLLGSVAEKTLRTAAVPILIVPPGAQTSEPERIEYDDILLPTDGSVGAERAVDWGLTFASAYDATVHTLFSVDTSRFPAESNVGEIYDKLEQTGQTALDTVKNRARVADVDVTAHLGSGPPADVIGSYSDNRDIDLIVMGTHGRTGIERYLIGSVTESVIRKVAVPVCCVPMDEA